MDQEQIMLLLLAGVVAFAGYGLSQLFIKGGRSRLDERLQESGSAPSSRPRAQSGAMSAVLSQIGKTAGKPFEPTSPEERSALRRRLGYAGLYSASATNFLAGAKAISLASGLLAGYFTGMWLEKALLGLAVGGMAGYMLPVMWLDSRIRKQRQALEHGLPDALDLMVVCVEAGLTVDAAMQRVGREISLAHPELARELAITHMESQMGLPRSEALRNLSRRTGSPVLQSLVAMLIQAERFGTGIASALRIHAESMRIKRRYAAEERAAKAAVKMNFPLVLCIFPALLIVVGGPAFIKIMSMSLTRN